MDLDEPAFGRIKVCEILGARPHPEEIKGMLEEEFCMLIAELEKKSNAQLRTIEAEHLRIRSEIISRPGAMALPQDKIQIYHDFSCRYIDVIKRRID